MARWLYETDLLVCGNIEKCFSRYCCRCCSVFRSELFAIHDLASGDMDLNSSGGIYLNPPFGTGGRCDVDGIGGAGLTFSDIT